MSNTSDYKRIIRRLVWCMVFLVGVHLVTLVLAFGFGHDYLFGLYHFFDLDAEYNAPSAFSVGILFYACVLLAIIAAQQKPGVKPRRALWVLLSVIFLYLAADEGLEFHERISRWRAEGTPTPHDLSYYLWLSPYAVGVLVIGLAFLRFLKQLPYRMRVRFITAGAIYVSGAMGMEELGRLYVSYSHSDKTLIYHGEVVIEETLEMVGTIYFLNVLLDYIHEVQGGFRFALRRAAAQENSAPLPKQRSAVPPR